MRLSPTHYSEKQILAYTKYVVKQMNYKLDDVDLLLDCGNMAYATSVKYFNEKRGSFTTFLFKVILNELRMAMRGIVRNSQVTLRRKFRNVLIEDESVCFSDLWDAVLAIDNEKHREIAIAHYITGFEVAKICGIFDISKQRVHQILRTVNILPGIKSL